MTEKNTQTGSWDYRPKDEQQRIRLAGFSSIALMTAGTFALFHPLVAAAGLFYTATKIGDVALFFSVRRFQEKMIKNCIDSGDFTPISNDHPISIIANELAASAKTKYKPRVFVMSKDRFSKYLKNSAPFYLRWKWTLTGGVPDNIYKHAAPRTFSVLSGTGILATTKEGLQTLNQDLPKARFIIAHEISHDMTDKLSAPMIARSFAKINTKTLMTLTAVSACLALIAPALPFAISLFSGIYGSIGLAVISYFLGIGAKTINNFGEREKEMRADRNAIHLTRDPDGGTRMFTHDNDDTYPTVLHQLSSSHPPEFFRRRMMRVHFNQAKMHKPPSTTAAEAQARTLAEDHAREKAAGEAFLKFY